MSLMLHLIQNISPNQDESFIACSINNIHNLNEHKESANQINLQIIKAYRHNKNKPRSENIQNPTPTSNQPPKNKNPPNPEIFPSKKQLSHRPTYINIWKKKVKHQSLTNYQTI